MTPIFKKGGEDTKEIFRLVSPTSEVGNMSVYLIKDIIGFRKFQRDLTMPT